MVLKTDDVSAWRPAWMVATAALVPLLLFLLLQGGYAAREERRIVEEQAQARSEAVILRADLEARRLATVLDALATSSVLRRGDLAAFGQRASRFVGLYPDIAGLTLLDGASGAALLRQGVTGGEVRRPRSTPIGDFAGYAASPACRCLVFERALEDDRGRRLTLRLLVRAEAFERLLPPTDEYQVAALADGNGHFIARSLGTAERFGQAGSTYLQDASRSAAAGGIYRGTTLEGLANYTAFSRSDETGWSAHLAVGSASLDLQATRYTAALAVAGLLSLALAALLVALVVRQLKSARQVTDRLEQAQKMEALGQLIGGLAHDFNNLLTPVIGTLDQLRRRDGLDERGRRLATGALASAQRAAKLTQQLLAFSRHQRLLVGPVSVPDMMTDVGDLIGRTIGGEYRFTVTLDPAVRCVRSDRHQLELALLNLAINARDASSPGSPIRLEVTAEPAQEGEGRVRFAMIDRGTGMDEETRRRALEPFFTTKPIGRGTGLGLAQVFAVVEQSGGTVEIDSAPGRGASVFLYLPACDEVERRSTAGAEESAGKPAASPLRLLIVEDEADVRATLMRMLSEAGHAVDAVATGASAVAALATERFDLVVADYAMPGMNGAELIVEARLVRPGTPFLIVSGYSDSAALRRACPDTELLPKPFTADELLAAVARAVSRAAG